MSKSKKSKKSIPTETPGRGMTLHWLGRPPRGATEVERLAANGKWVPDDGKLGRAFSGRDREYSTPMAWGPDCGCGFDDACPSDQAHRRTARRWNAANGATMRRVKIA